MKFTDRASVGSTKETGAGYLIATSPIVRTGIQLYRADELGLTGNHTVRVYRPPSEVFSKDAINSLTRVPVTLDHPAELVTSDNWAQLAKGDLGDSWMKDGEWIVVNPMIKDAAAIAAAKTTHKELSAGYNAEIVFGDGVSDKGEQYDAVMTDIRFNHIALVPKGRAGSHARIGDADHWGASPVTTKGPEMDFKSLVFGDKAINVAVTDADKLMAIVADKDSALGALKAELAIKDAELKAFKDAEAAAFADELAVATAALKANPLFGDEAISKASPAEILTMHKTVQRMGDAAGTAKDDTARAVIKDMKPGADDAKDPWAKFIKPKKEGK